MNCRFLYNPKSGRGRVHKHLAYIVTRLKEKFANIDVYPSSSKEDLLEAAKGSCGVYDYLIFAGGDGTFNDIVNAISDSEIRPILGYLPCGTICDIARNLKIPRDIKKNLDIILNGKIIKHDVGKINDEYFVYVAGFGDFTSVAYDTSHNRKKIWGRIAYYFGALNELRHFKNYHAKIELNGQTLDIQTPLLLVLNTKCVAGFAFNKYGHRNDGTFDVYVVKGKKPFTGLLNLVTLILFGHLRIRKDRISDYYHTNELMIQLADDTSWCCDGEKGPSGNVHIASIPGHIEIIVKG